MHLLGRLLGVTVLGECRRILERETHDIHVASAGAAGCQRDSSVGLDGGRELGGQLLELLDDGAEIGSGGGGFCFVEADIEHKATGFRADRDRAQTRRSLRVSAGDGAGGQAIGRDIKGCKRQGIKSFGAGKVSHGGRSFREKVVREVCG